MHAFGGALRDDDQDDADRERPSCPGGKRAGTGNGELRLSVDRDHLDATMGRLTRLGIVDLTVTPASLEDLFLREYRGAYPDEEP